MFFFPAAFKPNQGHRKYEFHSSDRWLCLLELGGHRRRQNGTIR